jgi:ribosome-associated protein
MTEPLNTADMATDVEKMVAVAVNALEDIKAKDIAVLDTSKKTALFARMIVASGDSTRQVKALTNNVAVDLKAAGFDIISTEGTDSGEWALVDAGDVVVHVMQPAVRDYYDIEALWGGEKPSFHAGAAKPWHAAD